MWTTEDGGRGRIGSLSRCSVSELGMRLGSGCVGMEAAMKANSYPTCFSAQRLVSLKKKKTWESTWEKLTRKLRMTVFYSVFYVFSFVLRLSSCVFQSYYVGLKREAQGGFQSENFLTQLSECWDYSTIAQCVALLMCINRICFKLAFFLTRKEPYL